MGIQYFPLPIAPWEPLECSSETDCASGSICVKLDNGKHCVAKCTSDANCPAVSECMSFDDGNGGTLKFCSNDSCDVSAYATPEVPIAPIPSVNAEILASLNAHSPLTMTPSAPALEGAIQYARSWATQHPGHTTIVIFATDGQPTACSKAAFPINEVKSIAAAGVNGSPSIRTFVIGVLSAGAGPLGNSLHEVAKAGGTNQALIVQVNQDMTAQFKAALEAIRGAFMQCEFKCPIQASPWITTKSTSSIPPPTEKNSQCIMSVPSQIVIPTWADGSTIPTRKSLSPPKSCCARNLANSCKPIADRSTSRSDARRSLRLNS